MNNKSINQLLIRYFSLTILISWLICSPLLIRNATGLDVQPFSFLIQINSFVPSVVAILMLLKRSGVKRTLLILREKWRLKIGFSTAFIIFCLIPLLLICSYLITHLFTGVEFNSVLLPIIREQPLSIVLIFFYLMIFEGPFGEEFGWRGFALERLLKILSPLKASVLLGFIWSLWHLPSFFIPGSIQFQLATNGFVFAFLFYSIYTICLSVFITHVYIRSNGSVFAAVLMHTVANFSHGMITVLSSVVTSMFFIGIFVLITISFSLLYFPKIIKHSF